ncbi:RAB GDP dissociation inhibitor alpha, putative [Trypanosoma equiperdum]|uniref:Rab GDP dissociation inhibitor n=4 Tax=Trypanozoon TaxID=39700 RepID=Q582R7_TRYB2|nr:RAB GDP dissociation inhibitor alpha, putative [Trypanosoma brucei gambiense DAL972]XP_844060.1 RAB GDP dissociation inhibitor alpha, putative [Trypanosoma brucei brucei TREU927]AAX80637.1 RAB GDP dissociation inhibitor alpha, putative [Trypanosoma brucei]RHW73728.1 RAB GDP dissociation inhibitor alpha [Trypanosoma brucei equiperdum]SCU67273.1 RAB GDP dissociation inhibitor alpha, putative [Trypanosoma equiperdum]AAZ10501.1 RAB GDP dissociation inhibitor alpha, putative [Trypanosoma brucei |eukprot:XP_011772469.1 RAB GDP dissociation inhibitor alpha, putative [Trypanosoma brucei gambiense DAL972]
MEETYDAIVCGTGLTECVLSGLLSVNGYKVLHVDRNSYYGGEAASLNLEQLYKKFGKGTPPEALGRSHLYSVDLIPKVLMCAGELVKILRATVIERYNMEFMLIDNSFVMKNGKISKVPATEAEALVSPLMGFFEKRRGAKLFEFIGAYDPNVPKTHKGHNLRTMTMADLYKEFGIGNDTIDFVGHAVALHTNDDYLQRPAIETVMRCKLYEESFNMYNQSPYVYPLYGNGELPQAFSRLCAVYGGTYMLQTPVTKVNFNEAGVFESIESEGKKAFAKLVVGDPSYFPDRVKVSGKVVRCIAIMNHPIPNLKPECASCQIIIPQKELKRKNDVYILQLGANNKVCPPGYYIAIIGTTVENVADPMMDIQPGLKVIGSTIETFVSVSDLYEPLDDGTASKCFISNSFDPATHFESAAGNILDLFKRIHGKPFDFECMKSTASNEDR